MKATVIIDRGPEHTDRFVGEILAATDTHLKVQHGVDPCKGEWFAIQSKFVNCVVRSTK